MYISNLTKKEQYLHTASAELHVVYKSTRAISASYRIQGPQTMLHVIWITCCLRSTAKHTQSLE